MPQETNNGSIFTSPCKNLRGLKGLMSSNEASYTEEIINDRELAQRKAEEAASRRYQAAVWLRQMDKGGSRSLPKEPSEEEFCLALRNGLILCNVLNKVNPGAVLKVVDNTILTVQSTEGAAQSAIQYFENMRNFLMAVKDMKLLTFEASDLEKGGSSSKVVDCILCLKGYYEWKQAGGIGVWRYGGLVKIVSFPKELPSSLVGSESADESVDESESSQYEQLLEFLHLSNEVAIEETQTANALAFLFDHFGLRLLQAYLKESNGIEELPLNGMVVDALLSKVVKDFSALLVSQGTQLGLFLKKILKGDIGCLSKTEFIEAISQYLTQRTSLGSSDFSKFCICGGKKETIRHIVSNSSGHAEVIDLHQKQLEELRFHYKDTRQQVKQIQAGWEEEVGRLEHHIRDLEVASSTYHQVLEENRQLYNQVQDLKGTIRVYCRVRPFLPGQSSRESAVDYIGENGNIMIVNPLKNGKEARKISNLKQTLERKEAEIEQIKGGSTRSTAESQRTRAVSPFSVPRYGTNASFKPETSQRSNDDTKSLEIRSCSSGKQRRSRFPSSLTDKETLPRIPFLGEEMLASSTKPRSPSPPVRRSISTDRGAHIRSRVKETVENQPIARVPFPARVPINKSIAAIPVIPSADNSSKGPYKGSQEAVKQDNISNAFYNFQRVSTRKVYPEHDEEQFRQALNIRQGGIRKGKNESKVKAKFQLPAKFNKSDVGTTMLSHIYAGEKIEEPRKSDFSEPENEHLLPVSPTIGVLKVKKLQRNLSRNSQNLEPRVVQAVEPLISGKLENKLPNNVTHTVKEGGNTSMPEFRRSRSTPRGKLVI
ncbi:HEAVY CHAIN putative-RELATED [Salix koriyanagi]|uniref:HEAVY CHAIN putative-RELATED n=1 Tax=Salix koriyanagi TaxID=2511006 RepID=A0A9Q0X130_9ROSI|nr:HEAVY CHAIN putative-RELATED [Salix koriyanagi]